MRIAAISSVLVIAFGAGCSTSTSTPAPLPPTYSADDVTDAGALRDTIAMLPVTMPANTPPGSASYSGNLYLDDVNIDGAAGYGMLGAMAMVVDFTGGAESVTGSVTNVNLLEGGVPQQTMLGSLEILGTESLGDITAMASGELEVRESDLPFSGSTEMMLSLNGGARGDFGNAVYGSALGTGTGDFEVDVVSGTFFGLQN